MSFRCYFFASAAYIVTGWWKFYLFKIFEINEKVGAYGL
jgi:hypothetical protein